MNCEVFRDLGMHRATVYEIAGVVKRKIVFETRPKPLISAEHRAAGMLAQVSVSAIAHARSTAVTKAEH